MIILTVNNSKMLKRPDPTAKIEELAKECIAKGLDPVTTIKWDLTPDEEALIRYISLHVQFSPEQVAEMFLDGRIEKQTFVQMMILDLVLMKEHGVRIRYYTKMDISSLGPKFDETVKNASYPPVYERKENGEGVVFIGFRLDDITDAFYETLQNTTEKTIMSIADAQRWFNCAFNQYDIMRLRILHPLIQLYDENIDKPWASLAKIVIRVIFMSIGDEDKKDLWMVNYNALQSKERFLK